MHRVPHISSPDIAQQIASGKMNPVSHRPFHELDAADAAADAAAKVAAANQATAVARRNASNDAILAADPHTTRNSNRNRRSQSTLQSDYRNGDNGLTSDSFCATVHPAGAGVHSCSMNSFSNGKGSKERFSTERVYLSSAVTRNVEIRQWFLATLELLVLAFHRLRVQAFLLLAAYVSFRGQGVTLANVAATIMANNSTSNAAKPFRLDAATMRQILSLSVSTPSNQIRQSSGPVVEFYNNSWMQTLAQCPRIGNARPSPKAVGPLYSTVLPYEATRMSTGMVVLLERVRYPLTKSWVEREVELVLNPLMFNAPELLRFELKPKDLQVRSCCADHV